MAYADKHFVSEVIYTGSTLGTFDATITNSTDIVIPISAWDQFASRLSIGGQDASTLTAEWLSVSIEFDIPELSLATSVNFWLAGSQAPEAITPVKTVSLANTPLTVAHSFNSVATSIDIAGTKSVRLRGYVDVGTVDIKFISLSYSPK